MPADAFGYSCKTLDELIYELRMVAENFPQLRDKPVWVDSGPPLYKPVTMIGIKPGNRGTVDLKTFITLAKG